MINFFFFPEKNNCSEVKKIIYSTISSKNIQETLAILLKFEQFDNMVSYLKQRCLNGKQCRPNQMLHCAASDWVYSVC